MSIRSRPSLLLMAAILVASTCAAASQTRDVVIDNDSRNTIYKLFAWPTELVPRTYNILALPLKPNDSRAVAIENVYGDCLFTFQADVTAPLKGRRPTRRPKIKPILRLLESVDLCEPGTKVIFR